MSLLPTDAAMRGQFPLADGLLYYFPAALLAVSRCSMAGNKQHHPGEPLYWDMDKSTDHANKIMRHLLEAGTDDIDGIPHSVKVAWRALALAQEDLMVRKDAPMPPNGRKGAPVLPSEPKAPKLPSRIASNDELIAAGLGHMVLEGRQDFVTPDCPVCGCVMDGTCFCQATV